MKKCNPELIVGCARCGPRPGADVHRVKCACGTMWPVCGNCVGLWLGCSEECRRRNLREAEAALRMPITWSWARARLPRGMERNQGTLFA